MSPALTYLAYSGGRQSHALLDMVLRGVIERPPHFCVITANPGMEDSRSLRFIEESQARCQAAGIPFARAQGPNLYQDLLALSTLDPTKRRISNPPYWTIATNGHKGRLMQKCTQAYKIRPMRRALRQLMLQELGTSLTQHRLPLVESWVGFSADEQSRANKITSDVQFIQPRFPLIELGYDENKIVGYYLRHGLQMPPRSVCCACFSNGLDYFEKMHQERPEDWAKAVAVDESLRHLNKVGVNDQVYVSSSRVRLKDLPERNWLKSSTTTHEIHRCNSGYCFA